jgi:hypothetical protein
MKKKGRGLLLVCASFFAAVSTLSASGVPNVDVTISDASGRLTYRGKTDAHGVFVTGRVRPGNYVVQFQAKNAAANRNDYAIFAAAGKHNVVADAVPGAKFAGAGVAVRLKLATGTPIIGQVALGGVNALRTKIVKGVRFVLLPPATGDLGARWVAEGTHPARNIIRLRVDEPSLIKANFSGVAQ